MKVENGVEMRMRMRMRRIMGFFLALAVSIGCLSLNPTVSYANDNANNGVEINEANFPDEAFRDYVKHFDRNPKDNKLSEHELEWVTRIFLIGMEVSSLKGIEYFKNLESLYCMSNLLTELDVSRNPKLTELNCMSNLLTELDVSNNTSLTKLYCNSNRLTSLDVSHNPNLTRLICSFNHLTSLDLSNNKSLGNNVNISNQEYGITVVKGIRKFKYSEFPGGFDKEKVSQLNGATLGDNALTVNSNNPREVTYNYNAGNGKVMNVKLNVKYFDPANVTDVSVKTQPKLSYTEGEPLDLSGLVVKLKDDHGVTKDVPFAEFGTYNISATPADKTELKLADNEQPVKLVRGSLSAETGKLTVNSVPTPIPTPTPTPTPTLDPTPTSTPTPAPKPQPEKRIGMIPKTGESASFAGLLAAPTSATPAASSASATKSEESKNTSNDSAKDENKKESEGSKNEDSKSEDAKSSDKSTQASGTNNGKHAAGNNTTLIVAVAGSIIVGIAALGFLIARLAIRRKKKMMEENNK